MDRTLLLLLAAAALAAPAAADAATVAFTGTRIHTNYAPVTGEGRCGAGRNTITIAPGMVTALGTSNLGVFAPTQSHCINPGFPNPFDSGVLTWVFEDGATLFGTYSGGTTVSGMPPTVHNMENGIVTGGTGRFLGATGMYTFNGTLRPFLIDGLRAGELSGTFEGTLELPAIPEPATWMTMIAGFGLVGAAMRRRPATAAALA